MDIVRRPKDAFLMGSKFSSTNLDRAGHFGQVHGSNRRRSGKQLITLDLNHFGFRGRGGQRGGELEEEEGSEQRRESGPTHKSSSKEEVRSQDRTKNLLSTVLVNRVIKIKRGWSMKVLGSRTVLNGGEREKEHSSSAGGREF